MWSTGCHAPPCSVSREGAAFTEERDLEKEEDWVAVVVTMEGGGEVLLETSFDGEQELVDVFVAGGRGDERGVVETLKSGCSSNPSSSESPESDTSSSPSFSGSRLSPPPPFSTSSVTTGVYPPEAIIWRRRR